MAEPPTMSDRPESKYRLISDDLRTKIRAGDLVVGDRLPAQATLAAEYGVTVMTLRQALAELMAEGLIITRRGSGTYVSSPPFEYRLGYLSSFAQEVKMHGKRLVTRVLASEKCPASETEAPRRLGLPATDDVHVFLRLRLVDGQPVVLQNSFVPREMAKRISSSDLERFSLYDLLSDRGGQDVVRAIETLRAVAMSEKEAAVLHRPVHSPGLSSVRLSLAADDHPVLFDRAMFPGDAAEITAVRTDTSTQISYRVL